MGAVQALLASYGGGITNSIQNVSVQIASGNTSGTLTINPVGALTTIDHSGYSEANTGTWAGQSSFGALTLSGTTLTCARTASEAFALNFDACIVDWNVNFVKSVQYVNGQFTSLETTHSLSISNIVTGNSAALFNGLKGSTTGSSPQFIMPDVQIASVNSVTLHRDTANATTSTCYSCILEFQAGVLNSSTQQCVNSFTATSANTTISSIVPGQSAFFWGGFTDTQSGGTWGGNVDGAIAAATTVTFTKSTGTFTTEGAGTVVEFKAADVKSVNRGVNAIAISTNSKTLTISAVNTAKSICHQAGQVSSNVVAVSDTFARTTLASNVAITSTRESSSASNTVTARVENLEFAR